MSDGSLSQDEIDALLQGGDIGSASTPSAGGSSAGLSRQEISEFAAIISELLPSQAQNLSNMVGDSVDMTKPTVEVMSLDDLIAGLSDDIVEVNLNFQDQISGNHAYMIGPEAAVTIAGLMMGQEDVDLNEAALSAIEEAANTLAGSAATTFGEKSGKSVMTSPGRTRSINKNEISFPESDVVKVGYRTKIDGKNPTEFVEVFAVDLVKAIIGGDNSSAGFGDLGMGSFGAGQSSGRPAADPMAGMGGMAGMGARGGMSGMSGNMGAGMNMGMSMGGGHAGGGMGMEMFGGRQPAPNVSGLQFPNLNPQMSSGEQGNIGLLMDVYMEMTVELGRTKKLIKEILGMGEGTIIELDKLAGEPVDILVNHKLIAKGEVVVIDENFGVRVTEIVSPMDRVESLG